MLEAWPKVNGRKKWSRLIVTGRS